MTTRLIINTTAYEIIHENSTIHTIIVYHDVHHLGELTAFDDLPPDVQQRITTKLTNMFGDYEYENGE